MASTASKAAVGAGNGALAGRSNATTNKVWEALVAESNAERQRRQGNVSVDSLGKQLQKQTLSGIGSSQGLSLDQPTLQQQFAFAWNALGEFRSCDETYEHFASVFISPQEDVVLEGLEEFAQHIRLFVEVLGAIGSDHLHPSTSAERSRDPAVQNAIAQRWELWRVYERLCIALLGHEHAEVRDEAVRLLNIMYDGLDWQYQQPHVPVIVCAGDEFKIKSVVSIPQGVEGEPVVLLSAPSFDLGSERDHLLTIHPAKRLKAPVSYSGNVWRLIVEFAPFPRAGFYDWRFAILTPEGTLVPLTLPGGGIAQGRKIVHAKGLREEIMHEVIVDMEKGNQVETEDVSGASEGDSKSQAISFSSMLGTFHNVTEALDAYKRKEITSIYCMGALERDNGVDVFDPRIEDGGVGGPLDCRRPTASPVAITCRRTVNTMLGGKKGFQMLVKKAQQLNIRLLTHLSANVSASRCHRRYRDLIVKTVDDKGEVVAHRGSDGKANQWLDQVLLNYRLQRTWDTTFDDVLSLVQQGFGGLYVQQAQSWPPILSADEEELKRYDVDGSPYYTPQDLIEGSVVRSNEELGYWTTPAARYFPNPFLVRLCRRVWQKAVNFVFLGKTYWGRTGTLIMSGLVPRDIGLAAVLAGVSGRKVGKDGDVTLVSPGSRPVEPIYRWLYEQCDLPDGSLPLQVRSICQSTLPYPPRLFGRGTWPAVDLLFLLPGVPMTFIGEDEGKVYRATLANLYSHERTEEWRKQEKRAKLKKQMERERKRQQALKRGRRVLSRSNLLFLSDQASEGSTAGGSVAGVSAAGGSPRSRTSDSSTRSGEPLIPIATVKTEKNELSSNVSSTSSENLREVFLAALRADYQDHGGSSRQGDDAGPEGDIDLAASSMPRVQSWSAFEAVQVKEEEDINLTPDLSAGEQVQDGNIRHVRSASRMDVLDHKSLQALENKAQAEMGPEFGFDLKKIHLHYAHRRNIRKNFSVFRYGLTGGIEVRPVEEEEKKHSRVSEETHKHIFAFCRWLPAADSKADEEEEYGGQVTGGVGTQKSGVGSGEQEQKVSPFAKEVAIVACNLQSESAEFTLHLESLSSLFLPQRLDATGFSRDCLGYWEVTDLFQGSQGTIVDAISTSELVNGELRCQLRPFSSMCHRLVWVSTDTEEEAVARLTEGALKRIALVLKGEEFTPSAVGHRERSDLDILRQLRHNFLFTHLCDTMRIAPTSPNRAIRRLAQVLTPLAHKFSGKNPAAEGSDIDPQTIPSILRRALYFACKLTAEESGRSFEGGAQGGQRGEGAGVEEGSTRDLGQGDNGLLGGSAGAHAGSFNTDDIYGIQRSILNEVALGGSGEAGGVGEGGSLGEHSSDLLGPARSSGSGGILDMDVLVLLHALSGSSLPQPVGDGQGHLDLPTESFISEKLRRQTAINVPQQTVSGEVSPSASPSSKRPEGASAPEGSPSGPGALRGSISSSSSGSSRRNVADIRSNVERALVREKSLSQRAAKEGFKPLEKSESLLSNISSPSSPSSSPAAFRAVSPEERETIAPLANAILAQNRIGPVVFVAPELGRWSTVGGLGVMVDELTQGLAQLGCDVMVISPYYNRNRKGQTGYLAKDGIHWTRNVHVRVGNSTLEIGVHEGRVNGVRLAFLHHAEVFPQPYPSVNAWNQVRLLSVVGKASLETLCQLRLIPSMVVTNDWFAGLVAPYARTGHFGNPSVFKDTKFFHLVHNLDTNYEGRQYPAPHEGDLYSLHQLPVDLLVDPYWGSRVVINPSRAAILASDTWGTVSPSYRRDLLHSSPLAPLLKRARHPFAVSNGIPVALRRAKLLGLPFTTHEEAKAALQRKYFGMETPDNSIPLFSFVGRVTEQKGVHLILDAVESLAYATGGRIQILCGGPAGEGDPYGASCAAKMRRLASIMPQQFWADPSAFFTDGPIVNLGSDFGLMPSLFEPGGIVQHEFFVAATPVIAFKTGGLKDSVKEFNPIKREGNGFTFEAHTTGDLIFAIQRALHVYSKQDNTYLQLRANAAKSVLEGVDVAASWYTEFHRVLRVLQGPGLTMFRYSGEHEGPYTSIKLIGSFIEWDEERAVPLSFDPESGHFVAYLRLCSGTYTYRYIVNGKWVHLAEYPTIKDAEGVANNVVTVAKAP